jgi:hypothetical protein
LGLEGNDVFPPSLFDMSERDPGTNLVPSRNTLHRISFQRQAKPRYNLQEVIGSEMDTLFFSNETSKDTEHLEQPSRDGNGLITDNLTQEEEPLRLGIAPILSHRFDYEITSSPAIEME